MAKAPLPRELGVDVNVGPPSPVEDDSEVVEVAGLPFQTEGYAGSPLVYRDHAGKRVKFDIRGRAYRVDKFGCRIVITSRRPETMSPEDYRIIRDLAKKRGVSFDECWADIERKRLAREREALEPPDSGDARGSGDPPLRLVKPGGSISIQWQGP